MSYRANPVPIPNPIPTSEPFWQATKEHRLLLQRCDNSHVFYYPRTHCPECLSHSLEWVDASGRGKIYSYTVARRPQSPEFAEDTPYIIVAVTLDEGPRMTSLLVEADPNNVVIDSPVEVTWQDVSDTIAMPYFRPAP